MTETVMGAVAANFGRDIDRTLAKLAGIIAHARERSVDLLVLPDATLGGYLLDLQHPGPDLPPSLELDGPEVARVAELAGDLTVCFGIAERALEGGREVRYDTAVCVHGGRLIGTHRKVHLPLGESEAYLPGRGFAAFDSPIGRMGMLIDFDKTFPESSRSLALDGAEVLACLSAWPASVTDRSDRIRNDRQAHLFDLYDCARAAENQVYLVSSNQTGVLGGLRFLGQAKVVDPAGEIIAKTWAKGGLALASADVAGSVARARRTMHHLRDRAEHAYRS
ncbi:carbon-nitrogen hydrolase family protein [Rathayibacter sp. AY1C7]|uniref:carbon-nitrogen hydrolase family protein n=1 Tax=unclassified Rathayibacter TaxID=2609250 RepID=UPI000CE747D3|nr:MULTISPECIES: carbon-nitrogen hydrolase family protein [unclassified Rathayibacter]PPG58895.1 carbon-nitrogen hydrolase family protein [Rathayibacter sp. AY1C7]PPH51891.1 carbon-nitrogen hydrolase family protein [Rathayibacter sp. AY1E1]